jgi:DNA polymerase II large subunit
MEAYFKTLKKGIESCYEVARLARAKGIDPEYNVEIPPAIDLAARVEELVGPKGIADQIRKYSKTKEREDVAITIAIDIARSHEGSKEDGLCQAVKSGLAILTEGIVAAPTEGMPDLKIKVNSDGSDYVEIYYAGPIRSAGGTAQALSVLIADRVRRELGIGKYVATPSEVERYKEEISLYKALQYRPSDSEIELITRNCPVCINGEGTEKESVSGYRDLPRVSTNKVRGGACLVLAEGLCLKAKKLKPYARKMKSDDWNFLKDLKKTKKTEEKDENSDIALADADTAPGNAQEPVESFAFQGQLECKHSNEDEPRRIAPPNVKYIRDILAGRPILSHPSRKGGFRLRYGRARTAGLASIALHPATMIILHDALAIGTQIKIERPGKAGVVTPCDQVEGPIVLTTDGSLVEVPTIAKARKLRPHVKQIVDLGEILIPFGEFLENNHQLVPGAYSKEFWEMEYIEARGGKRPKEMPVPSTAREAFTISEESGVPLHPNFNLFWHDIEMDAYLHLSECIEESGEVHGEQLHLPNEENIAAILLELGALHDRKDDKLVVKKHAYTLIRCAGLDVDVGAKLERTSTHDKRIRDIMKAVSKGSGIEIRMRAPTRIGARVGRPEKANERMMKKVGIHSLFPIAEAGGNQRLLEKAAKKNYRVEMVTRICPKCKEQTFKSRCDCGTHTILVEVSPKKYTVHLSTDIRAAKQKLGIRKIPKVKAVKGLASKYKIPEALEKGILRAKNGVFVFKDGTIRFDMTDIPITHFKPIEVGLTVPKAIGLGYKKDYLGKKLEEEGQILELKPQDFIGSESCGRYLLKVSKFMDEMLEKLYGMSAFYNATSPEDLLGQMVIGLAPHTSSGVAARLIGYTKTNAGFAHPFFHAAKRRNCDGDEDCVLLMLEGLINFSRSYLWASRGGTMDAPLVLTTRLDPNEIDKEAKNIDVMQQYPLELYHASLKFTDPADFEKNMDTVMNRLGTPDQYENLYFTHDTTNINDGPKLSAYKTLGSMRLKMDMQLKLAEMIRAVDESDTAARIINYHFLPDMKGNMRTFTTQKFRCLEQGCGAKYRRIPLKGTCIKPKGSSGGLCGGKISLTVHGKMVGKYLKDAKEIAEKYHVSTYTQQRIKLAEEAIESLFNKKLEKKGKCLMDYENGKDDAGK